MKRKLHIFAASTGLLTIMVFMGSTVLSELFGQTPLIAEVKSLIVLPGLLVLIPAMAVIGATGFSLAKGRETSALVTAKKRRMPIVVANGLLVLVPCAIVLDYWASRQAMDTGFFVVQAVELVAGSVNISLMILNFRDGLVLSGRLKRKATSQTLSY